MKSSPRQPRWHLLLALLAALSLIAAACGDSSGGDDNAAPAGENEEDTETSDDDTPATDDDGSDDETGEGDDDPVEAGNDGEPISGGVLRVGVEAESDGLNPSNNACAVSCYQINQAVFDPLTRITADGEWVPYLAESLVPNDDFTQWTVTLREGITFHDGEPLTTEAIVRGVEASLASSLLQWAILPSLTETSEANPDDVPVTVIDDLTAVFNLQAPQVNFPWAISGQLGFVPSPKWLDAIAEDEGQAQFPVGTGPFMLDSRKQDEVTRVVPNENWWATEAFGQEVYLDAVEFYPEPNGDARTTQFQNGERDTIHTTTAKEIKRLLALEEDGNAVNIVEDTGEESFVMINTDPNGSGEGANPFFDVKAREALTLATLRDEYIEAIGEGILEPANNMFHPDQTDWANSDIVQRANDPEGAIALAAEFCAENASYCDGNKINMKFKYVGGSAIQDTIADLLIAGWSSAFNVERDTVLQDDYITQVATNQYQVVTWRQFGAQEPDVDMLWLQCEAVGFVSLNWPRVCDEDRDELLKAQRASTDQAERRALWDDIMVNVNETYTYVFFTHTMWVNAFAPKVKGLCGEVGPGGAEMRCYRNGSHFFANIWLDE